MKWVRLAWVLILVLTIIAGVGIATASAEDQNPIKVQVLGTFKFTQLSAYMYNATDSRLYPVDASKVQVLDEEIRDLANDNVQPCIVLNLSAPTQSLNTNESVYYAIVLRNTMGSLVVGVADIDNSTVKNLRFFKISPVSNDVAIVRTSHDVIVYANGVKLSVPLTNYTNPKLVLMTDDKLLATSVNVLELRALRNPPRGFTLLRSGSGEATFTIEASGSIIVWFDEDHSGGDVDLFVFDASNPSFSEATHQRSWSWLVAHATAYLFADAGPQTCYVDAHGHLKFIIKGYPDSNNANSNWRVAAALASGSSGGSGSSHSSPTYTVPPTYTIQNQNQGQGLAAGIGVIERALSSNTLIWIVIAVVALALIIALVRR